MVGHGSDTWVLTHADVACGGAGQRGGDGVWKPYVRGATGQ